VIGQRSSPAPAEPLIAGAVHGLRAWTVEGERISAWMQGQQWETGGAPTRARCLNGAGHLAPGTACGCGLHGFHPWSPLARRALTGSVRPGQVAGIVEAWGEMEIHTDGFRAELARPLAFFLAVDAGPARRACVHALAAAHGAHVVDFADTSDLRQVCAVLAPAALDERFVQAMVPSEGEETHPPARAAERIAAAADWLGFAVGTAVVLAVWGLIGAEALSLAADLLAD
jgi:hypothetical protein